MMDAQIPNKTGDKTTSKAVANKVATDPDKATINKLRQEIRDLNKTIKEMQKPDIQAINIAVPRKLLTRVNRYLADFTRSNGAVVNLTDFICDAMDIYLWAEEDNKRSEEVQRKAELEKQKTIKAA